MRNRGNMPLRGGRTLIILLITLFLASCSTPEPLTNNSVTPIDNTVSSTATSTEAVPTVTSGLTEAVTATPTPTKTPVTTATSTPNPYAEITLWPSGFPVLEDMEELDQDASNVILHIYNSRVFNTLFFDENTSIAIAFTEGLLTGPLKYVFDRALDEPYSRPVEFFSMSEEFPDFEEKYPEAFAESSVGMDLPYDFPNPAEVLFDEVFVSSMADQEFCQTLEASAHEGYGTARNSGPVAAILEYIEAFGDLEYRERESKLYCSNFDRNSSFFLLYTRYLGKEHIVSEVLAVLDSAVEE